MKVRDLINKLELDGWRLARQKGSHRQYKHPQKPGTVTIAGHASAEVKPGGPSVDSKASGIGQMSRYAVVIEGTEGTGYSAYVPDLPGCIAAAATLGEVRKLIAEAITFHLEGMRLDGEPIPEPSTRAEYVEAETVA